MRRTLCLLLCLGIAPVLGQEGECASPDQCAHKRLLQAQSHVRAVASEVANESLQDTYAMESMLEKGNRLVAVKDAIQSIERGLGTNTKGRDEQSHPNCSFESNLCNWVNVAGVDFTNIYAEHSGDWHISSPQEGIGPSNTGEGSAYLAIQSKQNSKVESYLRTRFALSQNMELQFKANIQGVYPTSLMIWVADSFGVKNEWIAWVNPGEPWADDHWEDCWLDLSYYTGYWVKLYIVGYVTGHGHNGSGYVAIDSVKLVPSTGRAPQPWTLPPTPLPNCGFEDHKNNLCGWFNEGWPHWLRQKEQFDSRNWPDQAAVGKYYLRFSSESSDREATLKSPKLVVEEPMYIQFKYNIVGGTRPNSLKVALNSKVVWEQVAGIKPCTDDNWKVGSVDLSEYFGTGEAVRITFVATAVIQASQAAELPGHVAIDALEFIVGTAPPPPQATAPDMRSDCWCTGDGNEYKCADGEQDYCACWQACVRQKCNPFKKGQLGQACWDVPGKHSWGRRRRCR